MPLKQHRLHKAAAGNVDTGTHHDKYGKPLVLTSAQWQPFVNEGQLSVTLEGETKAIETAATVLDAARIVRNEDMKVQPDPSAPAAKLKIKMRVPSEAAALAKLESVKTKTRFNFDVTSVRDVTFDQETAHAAAFTPKVHIYLGDGSQDLDRKLLAKTLQPLSVNIPGLIVATPRPTQESPEKRVVVRGETLMDMDDAKEMAAVLAAKVKSEIGMTRKGKADVVLS